MGGSTVLMVIIGLIMYWVFDLNLWLSALIGVIAGIVLYALIQPLFTASPAPNQTPLVEPVSPAEEKLPEISNQDAAAELRPDQESNTDKPVS